MFELVRGSVLRDTSCSSTAAPPARQLQNKHGTAFALMGVLFLASKSENGVYHKWPPGGRTGLGRNRVLVPVLLDLSHVFPSCSDVLSWRLFPSLFSAAPLAPGR